VVRLKTPRDGKTTLLNLLRGEISIDNAEVDDQGFLRATLSHLPTWPILSTTT